MRPQAQILATSVCGLKLLYLLVFEPLSSWLLFVGQAVCLQHLGNVFKMQKDNILAIDFFERCLEVRSKVLDKRGMADCHDSLALVYYDLATYASAVLHYRLLTYADVC